MLLITSLGTGRWVIPKGHIEPGLLAYESAEFEAYEEAGLRGRTKKRSIGEYHYVKRDRKGSAHCRVRVYPMEVEQILDDYPEAGMRERKWMEFDEAASAVEEEELKDIIRTFGADLARKALTSRA